MEAQSQIADLSQKVLDIKYFPVPSSIILNLFRTIAEKNFTFEGITAIVEPDAALCAQLLKVANSAYFGLRGKVNTLEKAIMLIGVNEVRNLSLAICLVNQFHRVSLAKGFDLKRFWIHNLLTALSAKELAKDKPFLDPDELYLLGLLHDIGRLVMAQVMPEEFHLIHLNAKKLGVLPWDVERAKGLTHTFWGQRLAKRWGLTEKMAHILAYHHEPLRSGIFSRECATVNISAFIAKTLEAKAEQLPEPKMPGQKILVLAGTNLDETDLLMGKIQESYDDVEALSDIVIGHC